MEKEENREDGEDGEDILEVVQAWAKRGRETGVQVDDHHYICQSQAD